MHVLTYYFGSDCYQAGEENAWSNLYKTVSPTLSEFGCLVSDLFLHEEFPELEPLLRVRHEELP